MSVRLPPMGTLVYQGVIEVAAEQPFEESVVFEDTANQIQVTILKEDVDFVGGVQTIEVSIKTAEGPVPPTDDLGDGS